MRVEGDDELQPKGDFVRTILRTVLLIAGAGAAVLLVIVMAVGAGAATLLLSFQRALRAATQRHARGRRRVGAEAVAGGRPVARGRALPSGSETAA